MKIYNVFTAINSELECSLLKGIEDLHKGFCGEKDIDILVRRHDQFALQRILTDFGFRQVVSGWHKKQHGTEHYLFYEEDTDQFHHIHVHYCIIIGTPLDREYELFCPDTWIQQATMHPTFPIKVPPTELIMAFEMLRAIIETNSTFEAVLVNMIRWIRNPSYLHSSKYKFYRKFQFFHDIINNDRLRHIIADDFSFAQKEIETMIGLFEEQKVTFISLWFLRRKATKALKPYQRIHPKDTRALRKLCRLEIRRQLSFRSVSSGGLIISVIGADGSGKSTMCQELTKWLQWGRFTVRTVHLGEPKKIIRVKLLSYIIGLNKMMGFTKVASYITGIATLINTKERAKLLAFAHHEKSKGNIVITDRYPLKEFWNTVSKTDSPKLDPSNRFHKAIVNIFTKFPDYPDVLIFLQAPDEVLLQRRKKEVDKYPALEKLIRQKNSDVKKVAEQLGIQIFDSSVPKDLLYKQVRSYIWNHI